ncbi:MAG: response regulator transcription factor [Bacillota bacterium]
MRLLLVEDEKRLADALAWILKKNNYGVDVAYDGEVGQELADSGLYDLVILDRMLPRRDGVTILKEMRREGVMTPVLMLTARDTVGDRVEGLDAGADDYLIKPFATEELLARIKALLRRPAVPVQDEIIKTGDLSLDPRSGGVGNGRETIKLTVKESQLLEYLMRHSGRVLTRDQIMNKVWGFDAEVEANAVEIYIHFLRKKLKQLDSSVCIKTLRGIGYGLKVNDNVSKS